MKTILLASTFLFAIAGSALAADVIISEPIPEPASAGFVWTGGYVGLQAGYAWSGDVGHQFRDRTESFNDYDLHVDGAFGGFYAGYNYQLANGIVLGAEGDIAFGDIGVTGGAVGNTGYYSTTSVDWTGSARLRAGYAIDRFLPYISGGVAYGRFSFDERSEDDPNFRSTADADLVGWTLGGGAEYALTDNWIMRGEYRYIGFNDKEFVASSGEQFTAKIRTHDIRFGVAYKF